MVALSSMVADLAAFDFAVTTLWLFAGILAAASFALCRWRRWTAIPVFPVAVVWLFILFSDIHSEYVGPVIFRGISRRHVDQTTFAANLPLLFGVRGLIRKRRQTI